VDGLSIEQRQTHESLRGARRKLKLSIGTNLEDGVLGIKSANAIDSLVKVSWSKRHEYREMSEIQDAQAIEPLEQLHQGRVNRISCALLSWRDNDRSTGQQSIQEANLKYRPEVKNAISIHLSCIRQREL
jgi:hypothetical protein